MTAACNNKQGALGVLVGIFMYCCFLPRALTYVPPYLVCLLNITDF